MDEIKKFNLISMKVSVVTPNYNGEKFLKTFFASLNDDFEYIGEVIIVDNGSSDNSLDFIKNNSFNFPVRIIENSENLGFSPAVNQGIREAKYEYIFSLNNDTEVKEGSIKALVDLISSDDKIFSAQAKMLQYSNKDLIDDVGDEYNLLAWTKKRGENHKSTEFSEVCEIFSACAGAAMYKKSLLGKVGMFDDNFFAYMEDVDLAVRSRINGYKNVLCPNAIVYHIGSATSGSRYNEFKVKLAARNNIWVVYKNLPIPLKIANFIFLFLGFLIKYVFFIKKGFGSAYLAGIREGLSTRGKIKKVKFKSSNAKNYFKIEYRLIINTFKFIKK
nr:glycosyltransferase family 2 protein [Methanobrevibacter sp. V14]